MVQFPPFAFSGLWIHSENIQTLLWMGYPIRKSPDLRLFAPTRGLSQLTTSFIAYLCQGIHHMLLVAWPKTWLSISDNPRPDFQMPNPYFKEQIFCIKLYFMVELIGIEPTTSALQKRRSPYWAIAPYSNQSPLRPFCGGPKWSWTTDLPLIRRTL